VWVGDGDIKVWFEAVVDERVVAWGFDGGLCAAMLARELYSD